MDRPFPSRSPNLSVCAQPSPSIKYITLSLPEGSLLPGPTVPRPAASAYHVLDDFILPVLPLHLQQMVAEIKQVKASLLAQQDDDGAASPIQAVTKALPGVQEGEGEKQRRKVLTKACSTAAERACPRL